MIELDKGSVIFKNRPEDFIVEEVWGDLICKVSSSPEELENAKVDFGKLDINDRRAFLTCELEKINIDHFSAFSILARELNNSPHELGCAGTKDKIAWTCQRVSIFNANLEKIKNFSFPGMALKKFQWAKHKIKTGDLSGNQFIIVLRDVDKTAIKILNKVRNSKECPNFFGMQRFGSLRNDNVKIGTLIFKQKFQEAVFAYLTGYGKKESEKIKEAKKKLLKEKNVIEAKKYFPAELNTEHAVIDYLSSHENDWIGALHVLGEKVLLIMCQAVQSKLFNEMLTQAIERNISLKKIDLNLIGHDFNFSPGVLGKIEYNVLKENNLDIKDFNIPQIPFLSLRSSKRKSSFEAYDIEIETRDDEIFPPSKKVILKFKLDSGIYATTFLEQFFDLR